MVQEVHIFLHPLERSDWEMQEIEQSCVCFVCPVIFIDRNGYTLCLPSIKKIEGYCLCMSALALKNLLEGKMGDHKKLRPF